MGDQKRALGQLGVKDFNPETELPEPRPRCYGNFGTIVCHKDQGGMCGPYAEPCEVYTSLIPSKFDTRALGRSKVRNSKIAKEAIRRLIKRHREVFDRLARGSGGSS